MPLVLSVSDNEDNRNLLVVLFSGFDPKFLERNRTPFLNKIKNFGTSAPYTHSVFPPTTAANSYSISTGLFPTEHGIFHDRNSCDSNMQDLFGENLYRFDEHIEPIWVNITNIINILQ